MNRGFTRKGVQILAFHDFPLTLQGSLLRTVCNLYESTVGLLHGVH